MSTDLVDLIATLKARHHRAFDADLCRLRLQHGNAAVSMAMRLLDQRELRSALSVSGHRQRVHAARMVDRDAQALFAKKDRG